MSKTKRYTRTTDGMFKSEHRNKLKESGRVHLPPNKIEIPKTAYKRKKVRRFDIDTED